MSYGITTTGFVPKDFSTILTELQNEAIRVYGPDTDLRATNPLMIFLNIMASREQELWNVLADMYNNYFIITADGTALDFLAVDRGLTRTSAVKAIGIVTVTGTPGTIIPGASVFSTSGDDIIFYESSAQDGIGQTTETFEFADMTPIAGPRYEFTLANPPVGALGTGQITCQIFPTDLVEVASLPTTGQFSVDYGTGVVTIFDNPGSATTSVTYFDSTVTTVDISVNARATGSDSNVGASQINTIVSPIIGAASVLNALGISGGTNIETDAELRQRLIAVPVAEWTEADLESVVENITGVRSAFVDDGEIVEVFTDSDQSAESTYYKVDLTTNADGVFRVTHYDDSTGNRTDFEKVVSDPGAGEYRLDSISDPHQLEYGTFLDTDDTLTVTYMDIDVGFGVFTLKVVADAPPLTSTLIDSIDNIVKTAKPFGVSFFIEEPIFSNIGITITVQLESGYTLGGISGDISSEVTTYLNTLIIEDPLRHNRIIDVVMDVTGVLDITTVEYRVQNEVVIRGAGATDALLHTALSLPSTITDEDSVIYSIATDYVLIGGEVDWSPAGSEPAADKEYTVSTYDLTSDISVASLTNVLYVEGTVTPQE